METAYAQALWNTVVAGKEPKEAVTSLVKMLEREGRKELLPRIIGTFTQLAQRESRATRTRIFVADEKDARAAVAEAGAKEADVCVDETLIGGWRLEESERLVDASFKKQLVDIFNNVTA